MDTAAVYSPDKPQADTLAVPGSGMVVEPGSDMVVEPDLDKTAVLEPRLNTAAAARRGRPRADMGNTVNMVMMAAQADFP
jgi:hypothetical protein